jgi:hypothetical protein
LPFIQNNCAVAPDLVVQNILATTSTVQVVIMNQGDDPVETADAFWVDFYVDPNPPPTAVNQVWNDGRSTQGIVWGVSNISDVNPQPLPLAPGGVFTLTVGDAYYWPSYSYINWPLQAGTPVYAQVDSANISTTYGAVLENHEIVGGFYNNIISSTVQAGVGIAGVEFPETNKSWPASPSRLPPRP